MKKLNRKGFTIIELVIVIAVIAILAAVMVPTFSSIVTKANESAAQQEAAAYYKEVLALDLSDGELDGQEGEGNCMKYIAADSSKNIAEKVYKVNQEVNVYNSAENMREDKNAPEVKYIIYNQNATDGEYIFTFVTSKGYTAKTNDGKTWDVGEPSNNN